MFKKFLEPRPERRPKTFQELNKFIDDRWLAKGAEKEMAENEPDELCPSMYSFHSSPEEKDRLLSDLAQAGIETTVDRVAKKARIRDWIETSVIAEEDEEGEDEEDNESTSTPIRAPVAGHISSIQATQKTIINSTIKDASRKHIDPRTGELQVGPSEMVKASPEPPEHHSSSSAGSGGQYRENDNIYNNATTSAKDNNKQSMVNGRLEFPVHQSNTNGHNNVRTYNESYEYSSRSLIEGNYSSQSNPITKTSTAAVQSQRQHGRMTKMDSGYSSTEKILSNTNLSVPRQKSNSDSAGSLDNNNSLSSKDASPFDVGTDSDSRGSTGFVQRRGITAATAKGSAYDSVKIVKKK